MHSLLELFAEPMLDQHTVLDRAQTWPETAREKELEALRSQLLAPSDANSRQETIRSAQIAVAWLPITKHVIIEALSSNSAEIKFACLCAMSDLSASAILDCGTELILHIWKSAAENSDDPDETVAYMAATVLSRLPDSTLNIVITDELLECASSYFIGLLQDLLHQQNKLVPLLLAEVKKSDEDH